MNEETDAGAGFYGTAECRGKLQVSIFFTDASISSNTL
jgi:hypothetical protein